MKVPKEYYGREQTYLKHWILEHYLEKAALIIGWHGDFVYVDGFSGPWKSNDGAFSDTSFTRAISTLKKVRGILASRRVYRKIRCIFVERDPRSFAELERATRDVSGVEVNVINSDFEGSISRVSDLVGNTFTLTFIDPTGWTGFSMQKIAPLLRGRGEVLINFMYDHINRFLSDKRPGTKSTFNGFFGGHGWETAVEQGGDAAVALYQKRLKRVCRFDHATHARVLMITQDRTHFHIVYATRHTRGLEVFRAVEKEFLKEQVGVRLGARQSNRIQKTGQTEFFDDSEATTSEASNTGEQLAGESRARELVLGALGRKSPLRYSEIYPRLLEIQTVDKSAASRIVMSLRDAGSLRIEGLEKRQRLIRGECLLVNPE